MMAGSHVALGVAAWLVASPHLGLGPAEPAALGIAAAASLLPDIDHPKSWVGQRLRPISAVVSAIFGHRGITHSALAVFACTWVLLHGGAPRWAVDAAAVGYASHLAADLLTPNGLRLAWPMRRTWSLPLCPSGSQAEPLVVAALVWWAASGTLVPPPLRQAWHLLTEPSQMEGHRDRSAQGTAQGTSHETIQRTTQGHALTADRGSRVWRVSAAPRAAERKTEVSD